MYKFAHRRQLPLTVVLSASAILWTSACSDNPYEVPAPELVSVTELTQNRSRFRGQTIFLTGTLALDESSTYVLVEQGESNDRKASLQVRLQFKSDVDPVKMARCVNQPSLAAGELLPFDSEAFLVSYIVLLVDLKSHSGLRCT
jgi:hypothetical protein